MITWKHILVPARLDIKLTRMRIACWIPKATNTNSEYVIFIAFPLQQCLHERVSVLRYMYSDCLIRYKFLLEAGKNDVLADGPKEFQALNRDTAEGLQQEVPEIFSTALSSEDCRSLPISLLSDKSH